jgi:hypothetical protein
MKRNQYKNEMSEEQRKTYIGKTKAYQERRARKYDGYSVYYLPEEHYIGISKNILARISKHKHLGRLVSGWEVICSYENPIEAHLLETLFHLRGYNGYRP